MSDNPAAGPESIPGQPSIGFREIGRALEELDLGKDKPVLVHSSLKSIGNVQGGAETVVGALLKYFNAVMMPTFTYRTLVIPESGPADNALVYGTHSDRNKMAEFYFPDMPASRLMGRIAETLRQHPDAFRSGHPVLSFCGINLRRELELQSLTEPFAPIASLTDQAGYVLLIGVDHTANTSIHLGERLAGRKTYTRWALLPEMVVKCENFPYCSDGFNSIHVLVDPFIRKVTLGNALLQAIPMYELVETTRQLVSADPLALLCEKEHCPSCTQIRSEVQS